MEDKEILPQKKSLCLNVMASKCENVILLNVLMQVLLINAV